MRVIHPNTEAYVKFESDFLNTLPNATITIILVTPKHFYLIKFTGNFTYNTFSGCLYKSMGCSPIAWSPSQKLQ